MNLKEMAIEAKKATVKIRKASTEQKNRALFEIKMNLQKNKKAILDANVLDRNAAKERGLDPSLLERLSLESKLDGILLELDQVIALPDPIQEIFDEKLLPNGLKLSKRRVPIGVIGVIYESRPNVTIDISALCIKSGNVAILRGGSETLHTNKILVPLIQQSLLSAGLPEASIQLIANSDRSEIKELLKLHQYIDLIIPRGSSVLQQFCLENSQIPVITGGVGICHLFVDETAHVDQSLKVILNAKTQRPTVCNALDTLLIHESIAKTFLPQVVHLLKEKGCFFKLDDKALSLVADPSSSLAKTEDWDTEWLNLTLSIKIVPSLQEAIEHIQIHSTGHSDGILTENISHAETFLNEVDSAAVYVNASTRFTDGGQFGLGAEVAISTQKIHARGPMALRELTSYKWIVLGNYHTRS